jgi:hypothetical protein
MGRVVTLALPKSVFVPFEILPNGKEVKCDTLPRFVDPEDVKTYISANSARLSRRKLQWREHSEINLIREYVEGVGDSSRRPH